ncbi:MAG TPA: carbohydrate-binding protein [Verrucomicrobiae bacterium]|jgi:hypothetical protein|nr:carbohydrate-binding protein [Verrucomicrobiae bacterium]
MKPSKALVFTAIFATLLASLRSSALPSFQQTGDLLVMANGNVRLEFNLKAGTTDFFWKDSRKIAGFYSSVILNGRQIKGLDFSYRTWAVVGDNQVVVTATTGDLPALKQWFTLDNENSFLTRLEMTGSHLSANWMAPLVMDTAGGVDLGSYHDVRALWVPFDNDRFVSYRAKIINGSDTGHEVAAFYDNLSRHGLVVGSVTHNLWKTGIFWSGSNNRLDQLSVFGGAHTRWTGDVMPHGAVKGDTISSPTIFVGFGEDWRKTMDDFADANTAIVPKLPWTEGAPFGWNSWGVTNYRTHISYSAAIAVSDSIHTNLQNHGFANGNTVYVNLDSFADRLSRSQREAFVKHCHANGQKAGIYWTPFAYWGAGASNSTVRGSSYKFSDLFLRDDQGKPIFMSGARALDPTHPGTHLLIDHQIDSFVQDGFDYLKLDFLSHGALEGVHYDTNVTTGIAAYNQGMQYLLDRVAGKMFMSESIAPLFPYQYAHSRRVACDSQASKIGNIQYTMNSVAYGWWLSRLYSFNDPDLLVFGNGPDWNENQSRLISAAVTSGLFLNGDVLTNFASINRARAYLTNPAINDVVRADRPFWPVEANTGGYAPRIFVRQDGTGCWCLAVFNYDSKPTSITVNLARAGIVGACTAVDLLSGSSFTAAGYFRVFLYAKQARLFRLVNRS